MNNPANRAGSFKYNSLHKRTLEKPTCVRDSMRARIPISECRAAAESNEPQAGSERETDGWSLAGSLPGDSRASV